MNILKHSHKQQIPNLNAFALAIISVSMLVTATAVLAEPEGDDKAPELLSERAGLMNAQQLKQEFDRLSPQGALDVLTEAVSANRTQASSKFLNSAEKSLLNRENQAETALALADFLDSGNDASTGRHFEVTVGGRLSGAPTMRIASLDWLGDADPQLAHQYSRGVLQTTTSADEAAIALRNIGKAVTPGVTQDFKRAAKEFAVDDRWMANPTAGYFEGLDALVYSGSFENMQTLAIVAMKSPKYQPIISGIADALVSRDPIQMLRNSLENPGVLGDLLQYRPLWFARPRFGEPGYQEVLIEYIRSDSVHVDEKETFFRAFPRFRKLTAPRLLTEDQLMSGPEMREQFDASRQFLSDIQNEGINSNLELMISSTINRIEVQY